MSDTIPAGVLLGIDFGSVRIGVAACDSERILAYPVDTVAAGDNEILALKSLVSQYGPSAVIVGLPLNLDGEEALAAQKVRERAQGLTLAIDVPVWLVDERLTTAQAAKKLREAGRNTKRARRVIDASAAVGILESVMRAQEQGQAIGSKA
ncbi:MAG: Holliday junction resolvase RuvX [Propionibacteriaceae bacterium]|nr:Holliday junction resolvase RuvX [Propionibacteriaceae bacterium]